MQEPLQFVYLFVATTVAVVDVERGGLLADEDGRKGLVRLRCRTAVHPLHVGDGHPHPASRARRKRRVRRRAPREAGSARSLGVGLALEDGGGGGALRHVAGGERPAERRRGPTPVTLGVAVAAGDLIVRSVLTKIIVKSAEFATFC